MKITIDLDAQHSYGWQRFDSKEEYDADPYSWEGHQRRQRDPQATIKNYRHYFGPDKFPCIALEGPTISNPDGPDEMMMTYLYDFEEIKDGSGENRDSDT